MNTTIFWGFCLFCPAAAAAAAAVHSLLPYISATAASQHPYLLLHKQQVPYAVRGVLGGHSVQI